MKKQHSQQLQRKLRIMRFAPWGILAAVSLVVVPHYLDANEATTRLAGELVEAETLPGELESIKQLLDKETQRTQQLAASMVTAEATHDYHNRLVDIARQTDCKVRRMIESPRAAKPWLPGQPIAKSAASRPAGIAPPQGGLQLETQEMKIEITGSLSSLKQFLDKFDETGAYVHTRSFSLSRPRGQDAKLELSIILLNLTHAKPPEHA